MNIFDRLGLFVLFYCVLVKLDYIIKVLVP